MSGRVALRVAALGYLGLIVVAPVVLLVGRTFAHGLAPGRRRADDAGGAARRSRCRVLVTAHHRADHHGVRRRLRVRAGPLPAARLRAHRRGDRPAVRRVAGRARPRARHPLRRPGLVRAVARRARHPRDLRVARHGARHRLRVAALRGQRGRAGAGRGGHGRRGRRGDARRRPAGRPSGGSPLPAIRWGLVYGVVLTTARALGEYGAVAIVSGSVLGVTQTLPLYVEDRFVALDLTGAFAAGLLLGLVAVAVLLVMTGLGRRLDRSATSTACRPTTPGDEPMSIAATRISKRFGDVVALDDVAIDVPDRLADRPPRPLRRRQVDAAAHPRRAGDPGRRHRAHRRRRRHRRPRARAGHRLRLPALRARSGT